MKLTIDRMQAIRAEMTRRGYHTNPFSMESGYLGCAREYYETARTNGVITDAEFDAIRKTYDDYGWHHAYND
jgi:hypothetical protein